MQITSISTGEGGRSHFVTKEAMPISLVEGQLKLSTTISCHSMLIHEFDEHFVNDWHNPPAPQYVVVLEGELQIQLKDNASKNFKPGAIFLAEDTTGTGHRTLGIKAGRCLVVNLEEPCA